MIPAQAVESALYLRAYHSKAPIMLSKLRSFLVCTIALLFTAIASAQSTIHVPADQPTIQAGINAANTGDTVLVAPGTYPENLDFQGKAITVLSSAGPASTTISGGQNTATVTFEHGETRSSILNGFTVTGGKGNYEGAAGGIYLAATSPTIANNIITANNCYGINSQASGPLIQNNTISGTLDSGVGNCGFAAGAGIWIAFVQNAGQQTPTILGNTIESNLYSGLEDASENGGGGIAVWGGNPVIESNIIRNNFTGEGPNSTGRSEGGGIFFEGGGGLVVQNLIYGNMASFDGGGVAIESSLNGIGPIQLAFVNNTIADNSVTPYGLQAGGPGGQQVYNNVLLEGYSWINNIITGSTSGPTFVCQDFGSSQPPTIFEHNDLYNSSGPLTGNLEDSISSTCTYPVGTYGNISGDPLFNQAANHDYHLKPGSPAIDTGTNSGLQLATSLGATSITTDLDGNARVQNGTGLAYPVIDMGAYEAAGPTSPQATTMLLTPSLYEAPGYGSITLKSTLLSASGIPTGSVTFLMDGVTLTSANIDSTGSASIPISKLTPGIHSFFATYPGRGSFTPASSIHVYVFVDKYQPTLTATSSPNPSLVGQLVTFTATISSPEGGAPSPITFTDQIDPSNPVQLASVTPNSKGVAVFTTSTLSTGNHPFEIAYAGDATHFGAGTNVTQDVSYASSSVLSVSPTTAPAGTGITLTATVSATSPPAAGIPTGTVDFFETSTAFPNGLFLNFATLNSSGVASITLNNLTTGTITCTYSGDTNYGVSDCNTVPVTITAAPSSSTTTTLAITAAGTPVTTVIPGTVVTLTATTLAGTSPVTPGQVNFCDATAPLCTDIHLLGTAQLTQAGTATLRFVPGPGIHSYKAVFLGTTNNTTSSSAAEPLSVVPASPYPTTTTLSAAGVPGNYTLSAVVAGSADVAPTGAVSFLDTTNSNYVLATAQLTPDPAGPAFVNSSNPSFPIPPGDQESDGIGIAVADFNGDGILDIAVGESSSDTSGSAAIFLGDGKGSFSYSSTFLISSAPTQIIAADLNQDGYQDLVFADYGGPIAGRSQIEVWLNDGKGSFTLKSSYSVDLPESVVAQDFNGDGVADLAVVSLTGQITVLFGQGDGTFQSLSGPPTGNVPLSIASADFNGDGNADLAVANFSDNTVSIFLGNGDGTFTLKQNVPTAQGPYRVVVGDFNGDGKMDFAEVDSIANTGAVHVGQGDGTFAATTNLNTGNAPGFLAVGDFNGDGKADLITGDADNNGNTITVMLGDGKGSFVSSPPFTSSPGPSYIGTGDFNGDGKVDFAITTSVDNTISIYLSSDTATATAIVNNISPVGTGPHLVDASYPGDSTYAASLSDTVSLTAERVPTALALTASVAPNGGPITLTASVSPDTAQNHSAGGYVTFSSNGVSLSTGSGSSVSAGVATLSVASLPAGTDALSAQYSGDTNFAPSTGTGSVVTGPPPTPDFTFTGPQTITFRTESSGVATLTLTSVNGFAGPLSITCNAPLPPNYLCTLSDSTISLAANGVASLKLTLHPNLRSAGLLRPGKPFLRMRPIAQITLASLFPLTMLALYRRRNRRLRQLIVLACIAIVTTTLTACGPDVYYPATPPGVYPISITATGSAQGSTSPTTHTLQLNANITP